MANIIKIADFSDEALDFYAREKEAQLKHRPAHGRGMFIAESPIVIERALAAGYEPVSFLMEEAHIEKQGRKFIAKYPEIPIFTAPFDVLTKITGFKLTRGMLCAMYRRELPSIEHVCKNASRIAVLENVVNPTNALSMDAVLLTPDCSDPLYRRAVRVSMGTVFQVPWSFLPDDETYVSRLHKLGYKTAAMALCEDTVSIADEKLKEEEKLAIILGTEGEGLMPQTIKQSNYTIKIPMAHGVDSLNVAAASAVAFWELGNKEAER